MKLTVLGSGTYQPELERHSSAYLVEIASSQAPHNDISRICFDFGRGAVDQLLKIGVHVNEIEAVFISHWHPDHVSDLLPLIHITIAAPADFPPKVDQPRAGATDWIPRKKPLKIYGPKGTIERFEHLRMATFLNYFELEGKIELQEIAEDSIEGENWSVNSFPTIHNPARVDCLENPALCFRLESEEKVLAYSGDSVESEGLSKAVEGADLAIIEAGWPEVVKPKSHLTGERAGKIAAESGVKKLILTHMSPYYLKSFDPQKEAAKYFKGEILLAKDLMAIKF